MNYELPEKLQRLGDGINEGQLKYHDKPVRVCKEFTFDSAHHLFCYEGKCKSLHGHTYRLQVVMTGKTDNRGIVIDFSDIKSIVKEHILSRLDHRYINEVLPPMNTTAENMVVWIYEQMEQALRERRREPVRLERLRLWETPTSYAEVTRDMMEDRSS